MNKIEVKRQALVNHFENCLVKIEKELAIAHLNQENEDSDYQSMINSIYDRRDEVIQNLVEIKNGTRDEIWGLTVHNEVRQG